MQTGAHQIQTRSALPEMQLDGGMVLLPYRPAALLPAQPATPAPRSAGLALRLAAIGALAATAGSASAQTLISMFR